MQASSLQSDLYNLRVDARQRFQTIDHDILLCCLVRCPLHILEIAIMAFPIQFDFFHVSLTILSFFCLVFQQESCLCHMRFPKSRINSFGFLFYEI